MQSVIFLFLLMPWLAARTPPDVWEQVNPIYRGPRLQSATLTDARQRAISRLLWHCCESDFETEGTAPADITPCLRFEEIPLASSQDVLLVSEAPPCFQGGTGGGGPMWLVHFAAEVPMVLASPDHDFIGWLYSIQPSVSHGYHDLVLGWHLGAGDYPLVYFRFDGRTYVPLSRATELCDGEKCRIRPRVDAAKK